MSNYRLQLFPGDCREVLATLDDNSVDSIVTDPPYELGFMGKSWDRSGIAYDPVVWSECLRVLKPGGHLLAFGGSRTYHRLACAIEDAGFEIRDQIQWLYGSGFPKSLNISKAIDKAAGAEREVGPVDPARAGRLVNQGGKYVTDVGWSAGNRKVTIDPPATPATDEAKQWDGWGTALKPAHEPIALARKPPVGTIANNVLRFETGGLNIDGCRIETEDNLNGGTYSGGKRNYVPGDTRSSAGAGRYGEDGRLNPEDFIQPEGRFPANVIHDGSDEVLAEFAKYGETTSSGGQASLGAFRNGDVFGKGKDIREKRNPGLGDKGTPARFFYCAKTSKRDRNEGLDSLSTRSTPECTGGRKEGSAGLNSPRAGAGRTSGSKNFHPTVKPTELMRYLVRLITPPGGVVLDPFMGSGSTGKAAMREGVKFIGIELDREYFKLARARVVAARDAVDQTELEEEAKAA